MGKTSDFPLEFWVDPVTLNAQAIWKQGPYLWRFRERDTFQPPGVRLVSVQIDYLWGVELANGKHDLLDEGDVLEYGPDHLYPVARVPFEKFEAWKQAKKKASET